MKCDGDDYCLGMEMVVQRRLGLPLACFEMKRRLCYLGWDASLLELPQCRLGQARQVRMLESSRSHQRKS